MGSLQARAFEKINLILLILIFVSSILAHPSYPLILPVAVAGGGAFGQMNLVLYRVILEQLMNEHASPTALALAVLLKLTILFVAVYSLSNVSLSVILSAFCGFFSVIPAALIVSAKTTYNPK